MVLDAVERLGIEASFCAGHSLGEYTALAATGALGFEEGVVLVAERAAAMHDAGSLQVGTMAAVLGLDDDQVEVACNLADADVWVANFNAPGQVVIAGSPDGVERAGAHARELGAKRVMALQVSGAFHTNYMTPARDRLRDAIAVKYYDWYGMDVNPETEITVTCGATEAMASALMAVVDPGDEVIVFEPFYENYGPDAILCDARPVFVPMAPAGELDLDRLGAAQTECSLKPQRHGGAGVRYTVELAA